MGISQPVPLESEVSFISAGLLLTGQKFIKISNRFQGVKTT
jgi:hypothetical protein